MALRTIVSLGDETLRKIARPVMAFDEKLGQLLDDMAETMYAADGAGLAAPQIGILRRCVVIDVGEGLVELINPEILASEGEVSGVEGCLSIAGRRGLVTRPVTTTVRAQNRQGEFFELTGEDMMARALGHELDHLDGVLYIDKMERELSEEEIQEHEGYPE